jgi:hypothetical protein
MNGSRRRRESRTGLVKILRTCRVSRSRFATSTRAFTKCSGHREKTGRKRPEGYASGPEDYRRLVVREIWTPSLLTPWELHTPIAVAAMKAGKYAATEVPAAITLNSAGSS